MVHYVVRQRGNKKKKKIWDFILKRIKVTFLISILKGTESISISKYQKINLLSEEFPTSLRVYKLAQECGDDNGLLH